MSEGTQMIKQNPLQYVNEQLRELREKGVKKSSIWRQIIIWD